MSMRPRALLLLAAATMASGGCSLAPRTVLSAPPVPRSWPAGDSYLAQSEATLPVVSYRDIFQDPGLRALIEQALANNRDVRVAAANLAAARAQVRVTRADQFPEISVSGSGSYAREGGSTSTLVLDPATGTVSERKVSRTTASYALQGGVASFELDLFGRLASATAAARDRALGTEAAARTVRLGLIADLALAWSTYAADRDLLEVARDTADAAGRAVTLTRARLEGGIAPRTDLAQAQQIEATAQGDVQRQITAIAQDENLIRLLVGAEFDHALLAPTLEKAIAATAAPAPGIASDVLLRRPDVVEAEYDLRAANADIGVARAQLFPTISLSALAGLASGAISALFHSDSFNYSGGGDASWSIFNAGGRLANVRLTQAQRDAALASYEATIQSAFRDVADALADQGTLDEQVRLAGVNTAAAADTARLTQARYQGGIDNFLSSLDAQRSLYAARQSEVAVRLALVTNRITIYRVIGGDQATAPPAAAASSPAEPAGG